MRYAVTGLKQRGLSAALEKLNNQLKHMEFDTQCYIDATNLPPMIESSLIMLSKEWITNILRHSKGNHVSISVTATSNHVKLNIGDNGKTTNMQPGNGIEGMRSRVAELSGTLDIHHDDGVKLAVSIPLPSSVKIQAIEEERNFA